MEKIINLLINNWTKGVDTYTHNGSTWLIFSESKQWVIELTESKTLWYNYNFFKELFSLTSMDVVDNQHYITKWVEDNIINKVKDTILERNITEGEVDDIIQDGVKETSSNVMMFQSMKVEDTIQNGVKHTARNNACADWEIEDTIQNGVNETMFNKGHKQLTVKNIIENGVKEIYDYKGHRWDVKDVIQDGVRDISPMTQYTDWQVEEIIENGVKETNHVDVMKFFNNKMDDVIENGVKETNWFEGPMLSVVDNVIDDGINHTEIGWHQCNNVDDVIEKGVIETKGDASQNPMGKVTKVIKNGINKSIAAGYEHPNSLVYVKWPDEIDEVLENGVKETKTPGKDGDIMSTIEWMNENNSSSYTKMIDDVIENGIKETLVSGSWNNDKMDEVIENGKLVSGTYVGGKRQKEDVESVIGYGTKNPSV
jgi:predicted peroxiredoxin